jgi:hypothetical protein
MARALRNEIPRFILQGALEGADLIFFFGVFLILGSFESQWTEDALRAVAGIALKLRFVLTSPLIGSS